MYVKLDILTENKSLLNYDCLIDSGAAFSILPSKHFKAKNNSNICLIAANKDELRVTGEIWAAVIIKSNKFKTEHNFIVADTKDIILGIDFIRE